jgi:hypothetical protein
MLVELGLVGVVLDLKFRREKSAIFIRNYRSKAFGRFELPLILRWTGYDL